MLDFYFCIDTKDDEAVCCCQLTYSVHEVQITANHISQLKTNDWIRELVGTWGASLLLDTKSHQESCIDIDKFVWRL